MDDYLPKPISPKALIEKVERWAARGPARESQCRLTARSAMA